MRASKVVPMKVGDAAMKPLRHSINSAWSTTSSTKNPVRVMNQQQLQLMMDSNISQSLKTLIRNVCELQGTRKFEYIIPKKNVPKPVTNTLTVRATNATRDVKKSEELKATKSYTNHLNTFSLGSTADVVNKTTIERLAEAVRALRAYVSDLSPLENLQGRLLRCSQTYTQDNSHKLGIPSSENIQQSYLFAFRDGFGRSSNLDKMRPVRNRAAHDSQRLFHSCSLGTESHLGAPQRRMFSSSAMLLQKKDKKECKRKGGSLPCLKPSGIVKQEASKTSSKMCEKFCMPCCAPARDPPECVVAQQKRECKKFKAPRPSYSECKKDPMRPIKPCECLIMRQPPCGLGESKSSKAC